MDTLVDQKSTPFDLAKQIDTLIKSFSHIDLGAPDPACFLADAVAEDMKKAVLKIFGNDAPEILVVDELSANALASAKQIRIRRNACFTDNDTRQLINHEAHIHVATSLNGMAQTDLPILQAGQPGTTKTQEGWRCLLSSLVVRWTSIVYSDWPTGCWPFKWLLKAPIFFKFTNTF